VSNSLAAEWTRESLKQGYFSYVWPCRRLDGTSVILKLSPDIQSAREQAIALTGWGGRGGATLLGERSEENGAALLIERIYPGSYCDQAKTLTPGESLDVVGVSASSVRGTLPSGLDRLRAQLTANARHLQELKPTFCRYHNRTTRLVDHLSCGQCSQEQLVLLHGDLHAGNLLLGPDDELRAIDPTPALGEPEQDIGDAAAKNDWGRDLDTRVEQLAEACNANREKVRAYARLAAWNSGIFHTVTGAASPGGTHPNDLLTYACSEPV
jgi:streptomycin 6-kinase